MASPEYVKSFMSGELLVGVRRSDPHGIRYIKMPITANQKNGMARSMGRYLSEEPSTYLR
jgi:hypothetical protein